MLTAEKAREIWSYDENKGHFLWKINGHGVTIGMRAGSENTNKYWRLAFKKKLYLASRVAWLYTRGTWPKECIDHINGDPTDDRICNLREATYVQNNWNRKVAVKSKTGVKGVYLTSCGLYMVQIRKHGKRLYLGDFKTIEHAKAAYDAAARDIQGEFAKTTIGA